MRPFFFRNKLGHITVTKDFKKGVNALLEFLETVIKGHWLACACDVLGLSSLDEHIILPYRSTDMEGKLFIDCHMVVDRFGVVDSAFFDCGTDDT